jgi:membrane-associated protease RseP (regulator of RpoE activity)
MTSHQPLTVSCRAEDGGLGSGSLLPALKSTSGAGGAAGGVAGGAAMGAVFGAAALSFIPLLGAIVVVSGVAAGAAAGSAAETSQQPLSYPELISVPMDCSPRPALVAGGALGLSVRGLTPAERREAGVGERGAVLLISVAEGGAAAAAGLRSGDLILAAGGHDVGDAAALQDLLKALPPGTPLLLRLLRNGQPMELTVTRPEPSP